MTFNQSIASANYTAANLLTACATNAGALDFSATSKTLTVEDSAIVSQDYSVDASPTFAGATFTQVVAGIDPTASNHLATKEYVDSAISFINDFFLTDDASTGGYFDAAESPTGAATGTLTTTGLTEGDDKALDGFITASCFPGVPALI